MVKVYTGGGDRGKTSLFSGERVSKSHDRVEAYGEIDELSAFLGALTASLSDVQPNLVREIRQIQADLLALGALLATTPQAPAFESLDKIGPEKSRDLEAAMDRMDAELPPLKAFILPGGDMTAAWAHIARTVCRRAERRIIALSEETPESNVSEHLEAVRVYINRLSDYLFVLARYCNHLAGVSDIPWMG